MPQAKQRRRDAKVVWSDALGGNNKGQKTRGYTLRTVYYTMLKSNKTWLTKGGMRHRSVSEKAVGKARIWCLS